MDPSAQSIVALNSAVVAYGLASVTLARIPESVVPKTTVAPLTLTLNGASSTSTASVPVACSPLRTVVMVMTAAKVPTSVNRTGAGRLTENCPALVWLMTPSVWLPSAQSISAANWSAELAGFGWVKSAITPDSESPSSIDRL